MPEERQRLVPWVSRTYYDGARFDLSLEVPPEQSHNFIERLNDWLAGQDDRAAIRREETTILRRVGLQIDSLLRLKEQENA